MTFQSSPQEDLDTVGFRQWVNGLTLEDLQEALQVSLPNDDDWNLLQDMIQQQYFPLPPVHPAALGYKQATSSILPSLEYSYWQRRRQEPRMFQLWIDGGGAPQLVARKCKAPWGQVWGLGCTDEQQRADEMILKLTRIQGWSEASSGRHLVLDCGSDGSKKEEILRMLQMASRGQLHAPIPPDATAGVSQVWNQPTTSWLNPTKRFFSLSLYLSRIFCGALWNRYWISTGKMGGTKKCCSIETPMTRYSEETIRRVLYQALGQAIKEILSTCQITKMRDSLLWKLLLEPTEEMAQQQLLLLPLSDTEIKVSATQIYQHWLSLPLNLVDSPQQAFVQMLMPHIQQQLALEMERQLLEEEFASPSTSSTTKTNKAKRRKRNKQQPSNNSSNKPAQSVSSNISVIVEESSQDGLSESGGASVSERNHSTTGSRQEETETGTTSVEEVLTAMEQHPEEEEDNTGFVPIKSSKKKNSKNARKRRKKKKNASVIEIPGYQRQHKTTKKPEDDPGQKSNSVVHYLSAPDRSASDQIVDDSDSILRNLGTIGGEQFLSGQAQSDMTYRSASSDISSSYQTANFTSNTIGSNNNQFYQPVGNSVDYSFGPQVLENAKGHLGSGLDEWPFIDRYQASGEQSILSDLFLSQQDYIRRGGYEEENEDDDDDALMAASTAASIASSTYYKDVPVVDDNEDEDKVDLMEAIEESDHGTSTERSSAIGKIDPVEEEWSNNNDISEKSPSSKALSTSVSLEPSTGTLPKEDEKKVDEGIEAHVPVDTRSAPSPVASVDSVECRSPSPQAPATPPPTLSPILVSLADLQTLKKTLQVPTERLPSRKPPTRNRSYSAAVAPGSLPNSPKDGKGISPSWSRDDLRMRTSFRDDTGIKQRYQTHKPVDFTSQPYKAAAVKSLAKPIASSKAAGLDFRSHILDHPMLRRNAARDSCARSETAIEEDRRHLTFTNLPRRASQEELMSKDETTTITSAPSNPRETEDMIMLREERDSFRDMCLTLGAEVAKLKAMLAAQKATTAYPIQMEYPDAYGRPIYSGPGAFDPNSMNPFFHQGQRAGAMSDAGLHRLGDHESQVSEDEIYEAIRSGPLSNHPKHSSSATIMGSESSVDFQSRSIAAPSEGIIGTIPIYDSMSSSSLRSRLTKDIFNFLEATGNQLKKQDSKRMVAIERFSRLVNTLWPRAQVKLYGSHMSGLCLPSSDLDFVVCLPAVHKNAPALAPGVLEGRNAINETSQKLLARELKGESWIDPRSIKLIERTIVPVIKVSTKDTKAKVIQLDISFDSNEHHGLEAVQMISEVMEELPLIRPLVLVLKQFLLDRGLLTSYTGGLSSYCLFLMVAKYLQEQPSGYGDCGSLLMGFLDFYGNCFDPRATGISVRSRQYFPRMNGAGPPPAPMWDSPTSMPQTPNKAPPQTPLLNMSVVSSSSSSVKGSVGTRDFIRCNSLSDTGSVDGMRIRPPNLRPSRFMSTTRYAPPANDTAMMPASNPYGRSFNFDPLFVEDPLSAGNNVGRNAFRIFQVQRAFSDAHRALVASLEWDSHGEEEMMLEGEADYPLLKCLLQSGEDVLYEL